MKLEFSLRFKKKILKYQFSLNPSTGSRVVPREQSGSNAGGRAGKRRDIAKLIVVFAILRKRLKLLRYCLGLTNIHISESHALFN